MTDDLEQKSDAELNRTFIAEVCDTKYFDDGTNHQLTYWPFCTDANAVLPWLEHHSWTAQSHGFSGALKGYEDCSVFVVEKARAEHPESFGRRHEGSSFGGRPCGFVRAAVIALIRAKRAEKS